MIGTDQSTNTCKKTWQSSPEELVQLNFLENYEGNSTCNLSYADLNTEEKRSKKIGASKPVDQSMEDRIKTWLEFQGVEFVCSDNIKEFQKPRNHRLSLPIDLISDSNMDVPKISLSNSWGCSLIKDISGSNSPLLSRRQTSKNMPSIFSKFQNTPSKESDGSPKETRNPLCKSGHL
eukprot:TRINITY_DN7846_c0_g1_i1.p1 TRINITY_DN7846_c0_g1~~TRINITY_DN7846_c0_g1_i1.p1  ORF type:complete len:177 (+),score=6.74 TRINITY_DN7846_c0_g1_i1:165-695(+)